MLPGRRGNRNFGMDTMGIEEIVLYEQDEDNRWKNSGVRKKAKEHASDSQSFGLSTRG